MAGIDGYTGKVLGGVSHVAQSIQVILQTKFGEVVQLEEFGSFVTSLLLRENLDNRTAALIYWCIALAIDLWEPRFKLTRFVPNETVADRRSGVFGFSMFGSFMPRAHLGDYTVAKANVTINV